LLHARCIAIQIVLLPVATHGYDPSIYIYMFPLDLAISATLKSRRNNGVGSDGVNAITSTNKFYRRLSPARDANGDPKAKISRHSTFCLSKTLSNGTPRCGMHFACPWNRDPQMRTLSLSLFSTHLLLRPQLSEPARAPSGAS
jgi:hypothetical protein